MTIRDLETGAEQVIRTTETHPFYVAGKRKPSLHLAAKTSGHGDLSDHWVDAGKLTPGDRLVNADRSFAEVVTVRSEPQENFKAYNLSVADYETFFVRSDVVAEPVWVHNCDKPWIKRGLFQNLQKLAGKADFNKFKAALNKGTVGPKDQAGTKKLRSPHKGFTHELKIGGSANRLLGNYDEYGNMVFSKFLPGGFH